MRRLVKYKSDRFEWKYCRTCYTLSWFGDRNGTFCKSRCLWSKFSGGADLGSW